MVVEVIQVVRNEKLKCARFIRRDRTVRRKLIIGNVAYDMCKLAVVVKPEFDQSCPVAFVIVAFFCPGILIVFRKLQRLGFLCPNKSLMIVAG